MISRRENKLVGITLKSFAGGVCKAAQRGIGA
jgi:hypothetical protein